MCMLDAGLEALLLALMVRVVVVIRWFDYRSMGLLKYELQALSIGVIIEL